MQTKWLVGIELDCCDHCSCVWFDAEELPTIEMKDNHPTVKETLVWGVLIELISLQFRFLE